MRLFLSTHFDTLTFLTISRETKNQRLHKKRLRGTVSTEVKALGIYLSFL